ncbi:angiotensin-converting enzyme [Orussus abietinus]|uniref:angiotensin-converting enzyme n=1 Tax=Orussus abietinus TaxID=222816 RepID=UPI0006263720|nr:angiotensin-converting enzyme [Orussus abietinus]
MLPKWTCAILSLLVFSSALRDFEVESFIEMTELAYEDACLEAAKAEWSFVNDMDDRSRDNWTTAQLNYGLFKKNQTQEILENSIKNVTNESLKYKHELAEKPGDALLNDEDWKSLVLFIGEAEFLRRTARYTEEGKEFTRDDVERLLFHGGTVKEKRAAWSSWHSQLAPITTNFSRSLTLVREAAKVNGMSDERSYWELLSGYPNGYKNAEEQWRQLLSLHGKIVGFVRSRLSEKYGLPLENNTVPAYLLGSLQGFDWTNIMNLMPQSNLTYEIRKNLWKKELIGRTLYKSVSSIGSAVLNQVPEAEFWENSQFNGTCPSELISFCRDGEMRVSTCSEASISNYLDAHKNVAKILVNQMMADHASMLSTANRYSALEEAMAQLFAILSVSPAQLQSLGLIRSTNGTEELQMLSLMITALDVLPSVAYYLSADLWRINALENETISSDDLIDSWWRHRSEYEGVASDSLDPPTFLDDSYIISNKPYLPKLVGTILAFQLYEYIMESTEVRYSHVEANRPNHALVKMIQYGGVENWMDLIQKHLELDEISVESLLSFLLPLEEYIERANDELEDLPKIITADQEREFQRLEQIYREQALAPKTTTISTTPTTTTTTAKAVPSSETQTKPPLDLKSDSKTVTNEQADKPSNVEAANSTTTNENSYENLSKSFDMDDESEEEPKMNTSKAVWAVAAVLVATVTICVIAIFGRRRCRKTPKNRRYV